MLPMKAVRLQLGELLAADATTLAPAVSANKIALVKAAFALTENLVASDLTLAAFTGSTPKAGATGAQQSGLDPVTFEQKITILAPAGGWRWECTVAPSPAETIYGFALLDSTLATLLGAAVFPTPIPVASVGDFIDLGAVEITFVLQPMS
jgi:hypothetical protein